ncbi:ester cyclase [Asaia krungthepensis]|uniref:Ester cyclase n=1 Tax=Asaia krungthepensis NRIC 0535 TaxID=1307925 RepID=A0ABQ0Q4U1_9PROT|nr:ester cyclase [Asaia krungthepensis]GBQ91463.1 hypothetical protein AA0535_2303 [Asaia krungthepensis NRIC 0535]
MRCFLMAFALVMTVPVVMAAPPGTPAKIGGIETPAAQDPITASATLEAARAFYDFWNTGDQAILDRAIAHDFVDHTPPPGRVAGPRGPALAARQFLGAIPDLQVTVTHMIVAGPYVTVHMHFDGHFTGTMNGHPGHGQPVHFIATDLLKIVKGRITDNWHLEDNLTLLSEMGLVKAAP